MRSETTVKKAAEQLDCKPNSLLAKVNKLIACDLIEITREVARPGRPIKIYKSTAEEYYIPDSASKMIDQDIWEKERTKLLHDGLKYVQSRVTAPSGRRVYLNEQGTLTNGVAKDCQNNCDPIGANDPALLSSSHDGIYLDFEDAKIIQEKLEEILQNSMKKQGGQRYLLWLNLVPLPEKT